MPIVESEAVDSPRLRRKNLRDVVAEPSASQKYDESPKPVLRTGVRRTNKAQTTWGRHSTIELGNLLGCLAIILFCPLIVIGFWMACDSYQGSLLKLFSNLGNISVALPKPTMNGFLLYGGWVFFQGLLYAFLPGEISKGQTTPAGFLLSYKINGLRAWLFSHLLFIYGSMKYNLFSPTIIYDNWASLLIATNVYGYLLACFVYAKAYLFPSHPEDRKFSGSWLYDFFMGIEFNPRFGRLWDFKLFHNGRPGIIGWTLINISFAAAQYKKFGFISNSMFLVNLLQAIYVLDFFIHEDWYLRTIDIAHDHFGFMLSWGDSVWLPFMYTLQARYLVENPVSLTNVQLWGTFALGISGYLIFRFSNDQKDLVRQTAGNCKIWGRPATFIRAKYKSADGKEHESLLLTSGFWGLARHFNYTGDLMLSLAMCLACGTTGILPYFYIGYMALLLLHRVWRDQERCAGKYGPSWEEYCKAVTHKLIPYLF